MDAVLDKIKLIHEKHTEIHHLEEEVLEEDGKRRQSIGEGTIYLGPRPEALMSPFGFCFSSRADEIQACDNKLYVWFYQENNEKKDPQSHLSWINEFMDLMLVALIVKLASQGKYEWKYDLYEEKYVRLANELFDTFIIYSMVYGLFLGITGSRVNFTYISHCYSNCLSYLDDVGYATFGLGMVFIGIFVPSRKEMFTASQGLTIGFQMCLGGLIMLKLTKFFVSKHPMAKKYTALRILTYLVAMSLVVPGFFLEDGSPNKVLITADGIDKGSSDSGVRYCFFIAALLILFVEICSDWGQPHDKLNGSFWTERFCILTMILIGETLLSLVLIDSDDENNFELMLAVFVTFCIMYLIYLTFFQEMKNPLVGSKQKILFLFFGYILLLIGTFFKILVTSKREISNNVDTKKHKKMTQEVLSILTVLIPLNNALNWMMRILNQDIHNCITIILRVIIIVSLTAGLNVTLAYVTINTTLGLCAQLGLSFILFVADVVFLHFELNAEDHTHTNEVLEEGKNLIVSPEIAKKRF